MKRRYVILIMFATVALVGQSIAWIRQTEPSIQEFSEMRKIPQDSSMYYYRVFKAKKKIGMAPHHYEFFYRTTSVDTIRRGVFPFTVYKTGAIIGEHIIVQGKINP